MSTLRPLVRPAFCARVRARRQERGWCWPAEVRECFEGHLRALVERAEIGSRVKLDALAGILADGRFKTRHEATGRPSKNPPRSSAEEARIWNVHERALSGMPIYGYLATRADVTAVETRMSLHRAYGSARVVLRPEARSCSTVFFGDSRWPTSHDEGAPAPIDGPYELAWMPDLGPPTDRRSVDEGYFDEVVELQIIGGVHISDIEVVVFDLDPPCSITDALRCRELKWDVNPLPSMSDEQRARFVADELSGV